MLQVPVWPVNPVGCRINQRPELLYRQRNQRAQTCVHLLLCLVIATLLRLKSSVVCPTQKHGLVIIPDGTPNGDVNHEPQPSGITVVSQEAAQLLESAGEGPLGESIQYSLIYTLSFEVVFLFQTPKNTSR